MSQYTVIKAFPHRGRIVRPGEPVTLTARQALYLRLQGKVAPPPAAAENQADPADDPADPSDNPKKRRAR